MLKKLSTALVLIGLVMAANAHPVTGAAAADGKLRAEVDAMRAALKNAADTKNAAALKRFYTDDFTHTHTSGKVDGKDARIVSLMANDPTVEVAPAPEFHLHCFGTTTCIARALSPIKRGSDGKWFDVRWTQTYVKTDHGWQMAISQATGLPNTVRDAP